MGFAFSVGYKGSVVLWSVVFSFHWELFGTNNKAIRLGAGKIICYYYCTWKEGEKWTKKKWGIVIICDKLICSLKRAKYTTNYLPAISEIVVITWNDTCLKTYTLTSLEWREEKHNTSTWSGHLLRVFSNSSLSDILKWVSWLKTILKIKLLKHTINLF